MEIQVETRIRRARPSDVDGIASFVSRAHPLKQPISREEILGHFGKAGLLIAESHGKIVGLLGWQVEDLVARVTDFLVLPASSLHDVGRALFTAMEDAAHELQCETAILMMPFKNPKRIQDSLGAFGYQLSKIIELPRPWQEAALEMGIGNDEEVFVKKLRDERVLRPI